MTQLLNLNPDKISAMRAEIKSFIGNYRAAQLLEAGLRSRSYFPIISREKKEVVPASTICFYCDFIRVYGLGNGFSSGESLAGCPTLASFTPLKEPLRA
ncbi:MAG: hypothetical protein M1530_00165 [Candidatus Marsarchaeota archaeon]|nr:hypothetical protein [Candidatus Marsarchaeota archaeon]